MRTKVTLILVLIYLLIKNDLPHSKGFSVGIAL